MASTATWLAEPLGQPVGLDREAGVIGHLRRQRGVQPLRGDGAHGTRPSSVSSAENSVPLEQAPAAPGAGLTCGSVSSSAPAAGPRSLAPGRAASLGSAPTSDRWSSPCRRPWACRGLAAASGLGRPTCPRLERRAR